VLTDQPAGPSGSSGPAGSSGSAGPRREVGLGVTGTSATDAAEELCIATGSGDEATAMKTRLQTALTSGRSQRQNEKWSELLPGASVDVQSGSVVRLTAHPAPDSPATTLFQALVNKDLSSLIGN
jgi:hypothetical protein